MPPGRRSDGSVGPAGKRPRPAKPRQPKAPKAPKPTSSRGSGSTPPPSSNCLMWVLAPLVVVATLIAVLFF